MSNTTTVPSIPGLVIDKRRMNKNFTLAAGRTALKQAIGTRKVLIGKEGSEVYDEVTIHEYNYKGCGKKIYALRTGAKGTDKRFTEIKPGDMVNIIVLP
jgi:hypothetical protein